MATRMLRNGVTKEGVEKYLVRKIRMPIPERALSAKTIRGRDVQIPRVHQGILMESPSRRAGNYVLYDFPSHHPQRLPPSLYGR